MAIRKRPGRASPFQVFWNNPFTGKRESKSFASLDEAKKHDAFIKYQLKYEREAFRRDEGEGSSDVLTLESLAYLYIRLKKPSKANTARLLNNIKPILAEFGHTPPEEITRQQLIQSMQAMREKVSSGTVRVRYAAIKSIMRWGVEADIVPSCPDFKIPKAEPERIPPPTPEEAALIIQNAPEHVRRVVILGVSMGIRIGPSEIFALRWEHIDLDKGQVRVWSAKKNPKAPWRDIPIKASLLPLMKQWKDEDADILWVIHFKGEPVASIKNAWWKSLKRAGITRRIRPYDLRHTFATEALAAGADIRTIAELMGHADVTMVLRHYQHVLDRQKKSAVEAVPDLKICAQGHVPKK